MPAWMGCHSKYADLIKEQFDDEVTKADVDIVLRNKIARRVFADLSEDKRDILEKEAEATWVEEKRLHDAALDGLPTPSPEDQLE